VKKIIVGMVAVAVGISLFCVDPVEKPKVQAKQQAVVITFNRPSAIGDTSTMETHLEFHTISGQGFGMNASKMIKDIKGDLSAEIKVLKVNDVGQPTMLFCTVKKATMVEDGKQTDPGLDGAQLGVTFPESGVHFVRRDGKEVSRQGKFLLSQIMQPPDGINPDDYLSAKRPVSPGESWKADSKILARLFSTGELSIKPSDIDAKVTFMGIEKWNDLDCYHVVFEGTAENLKRPSFMGTGKISQHEDLYIPVDVKSKASRSTSTFNSNFSGKYMAENQPVMPVKNRTTVKIETAVR